MSDQYALKICVFKLHILISMLF